MLVKATQIFDKEPILLRETTVRAPGEKYEMISLRKNRLLKSVFSDFFKIHRNLEQSFQVAIHFHPSHPQSKITSTSFCVLVVDKTDPLLSCAYVLRISRYSGFLWVMSTNTGIFLRGLKLCGESRT